MTLGVFRGGGINSARSQSRANGNCDLDDKDATEDLQDHLMYKVLLLLYV